MPGYVELQITSNYSFLRGASRIEELLLTAKAAGYDAMAVTDHGTLAGIARAHARAAEVGMRLVVGCRLDLRDGLPLLVYPIDRAGYGRLCRLITLGKSRAGKEGCNLFWADVAAAAEGLLVILLPDAVDDGLDIELRRLRTAFPGRCHLALTLRRRPGDWVRLRQLFDAAQAAQVPTVVTGDVLYHAPERRVLQQWRFVARLRHAERARQLRHGILVHLGRRMREAAAGAKEQQHDRETGSVSRRATCRDLAGEGSAS